MGSADWEYVPNGEVPEGYLLPSGVHRYAACVEYDGSSYCGWQRQNHSPSVQEVVEKTLSKIADSPVKLVCAGRTDSGVHASAQVVHFDTTAERFEYQWFLGANSGLPADIAISWVKQVLPTFHSRFSALSRTYRYIIDNGNHHPAILNNGVTWFQKPLDAEKMHDAVQLLCGRYDFSSFRAAGCNAFSPVREVKSARIVRVNNFVILEITANAFLQHMVRNIVGLLLEVGSSDLPVSYLGEVLALKDRTRSAPTASPKGLYFVDVEYPTEFSLPEIARGPSFLNPLLTKFAD